MNVVPGNGDASTTAPLRERVIERKTTGVRAKVKTARGEKDKTQPKQKQKERKTSDDGLHSYVD